MPNLSEQTLLAFHDELRKEADLAGLIARAAPRLRAAGSLAGTGAALGAAGGAALGGAQKYREARQEGASGGAAALSALSGAGGGALRGAGLGAAAGAGAGALTGMGGSLAQRAGALGATSRFGQRQMHALTGMLQPHELEAMGGGATNARNALKSVQEAAAAHAMKPGKAYSDFAGKIDKAKRGLQAAEDVQNKGLTSVPGYLRGMARDGVVPTLRTSAREQFANAPTALNALTVGLPALGVAGALAKKESPEGPGRGERIGESLGGVLGGFAGGAMPIVGNMAVGAAGAGAGKALGRGIDRLRGRKASPMLGQKLPSHEPSNVGQHMPVERVMTPAAAGQQQMQESA